MYKVELIPLDLIQQKSLERRQKLEETRKQRIFDPKIRTIGIDVKALQEQINEKNQQKEQERKRELSFDKQFIDTNKFLIEIEQELDLTRKRQLKELQQFRELNQQKHQQREYDLNDPNLLKREIYAVDQDKTKMGHSSNLLTFEGEDSAFVKRQKEQQNQMKIWQIEKMFEKEMKRRNQEQNEKSFEIYQQTVQAKFDELQRIQNEQRIQKAKQDLLYNQQLAQEKKELQKRLKEKEQSENTKEIINQMNGMLLTEQGEKLNFSYKKMSDEMNKEILKIQQYQRNELQLKRRHEKELKDLWDLQETKTCELMHNLQLEQEQQKKELNLKIKQENIALAQQEQAKKQHQNKVFTNEPHSSFFDQFNTTSR